MKLSYRAFLLSFALFLTQFTNAQIAVEKKPTDDPEKLKKDAVTFLRETMADVNNLRTLENRISFSAELASLMWFHDEKEARSMYLTTFGDFKELLMRYDMQMNSMGELDETEDYRGGMFADVSDRSRISRRFQTAMQVRQQIALSLAEHDPELAFGFYLDSLQVLTNPEFRKQMENRDQYFEIQLMTQVAKTNAAKAAQFAIKSIDKGFNYQHMELLKKIYEKDPEKGAEFAASILSQIKNGKNGANEFWVLSSFLNIAGDTLDKSKQEGGKKPLLNQQELRDLADVFAQAILNNSSEDAGGLHYATEIEKYNPARAAQIRAKFRTRNSGSRGVSADAVNVAANSIAIASNTAYNSSNSPYERTMAEREKLEKQLREDVEKLGTKQLPKEEREKIVTQARRILMQTPGKDKKILGLSALAAQVAKMGDKELASEIMKDAQNLINPSPRNYQDFLLSLMLASGYAEADPDKAFPLLEDTIMRANETLSAFVKVGEFIDVAGEMIDEGEVQVGAFGGQMVRGLTSELGTAETTLRTLARADFTKTKNLTNRFDRSEVRILAKMMILRALLGEKEKATGESEIMPMTETETTVLASPPPPARRRPN
jgi:hypothetical protein